MNGVEIVRRGGQIWFATLDQLRGKEVVMHVKTGILRRYKAPSGPQTGKQQEEMGGEVWRRGVGCRGRNHASERHPSSGQSSATTGCGYRQAGGQCAMLEG